MNHNSFCQSVFLSLSFSCYSGLINGAVLNTITFDELEEQNLNGVQVAGATFIYEGGGVDLPIALFGTNQFDFGGSNLFLAPSGAGDVGNNLMILFDSPSNFLSFSLGFAGFDEADSFQVDLFSTTTLVHSSVVTPKLANDDPFSFNEGEFLYQDIGNPFDSAVVSFQSVGAQNFVIDDVSFGAVPEVSSLCLLGLGGFSFLKRRRLNKIW